MRAEVTFNSHSLSFSHFLHLGFTSSLGWAVDVRIKDTFACVDMATRGMLSRFSLAIMWSNISYTVWLKICSSELIRQYKYFLFILANHRGSTLPELYLHRFIPALVWHLQFEVGILDICCKIKTLRWKWRYWSIFTPCTEIFFFIFLCSLIYKTGLNTRHWYYKEIYIFRLHLTFKAQKGQYSL